MHPLINPTSASLPVLDHMPSQLRSLPPSTLYLLLSIVLLIRGSVKTSIPTRLPWSETVEAKQERERVASLTPLTTPALEKEGADLFIPATDGSRTLLVPWRGQISKVRIRPIPARTFALHSKHFPPVAAGTQLGVNAMFVRQLRAILMIILPRLYCRESFMLVLHTFFLVQRTVLSVLVARLDGRIVRDLVSADKAGFLRGIGLWFLLAIPSTYTNAMVRAQPHGASMLEVQDRCKLKLAVRCHFWSD